MHYLTKIRMGTVFEKKKEKSKKLISGFISNQTLITIKEDDFIKMTGRAT